MLIVIVPVRVMAVSTGGKTAPACATDPLVRHLYFAQVRHYYFAPTDLRFPSSIMSNTVVKLIKSYREQAKDEFEHHKKFVSTYYVATLLVAGVGFGFIYKSNGFFPAAIVCIAIAAVTSVACFLFSLRTLRASEARYRPLLRFNSELCCMRLTSAVLRAAVNGGNLVPIKCFDGNQSGRDCG
jgi:hypothetical protein